MVEQQMKNVVLPDGIDNDWVVSNSRLLLEICAQGTMLRLGAGLAIPIQVAVQILEDAGFIGLDEVKDTVWIADTAYTILNVQKIASSFPVDKTFSEVISKSIESGVKEHLRAKIDVGLRSLSELSESFPGKKKVGSNTRRKIIQGYGRKVRSKIASDMIVKRIDVCPICLENGTKGLLMTRCCGRMIHNDCLSEWLKNKPTTCPVCRSEFKGAQSEVSDYRRIFLDEEDMKRNREEYKIRIDREKVAPILTGSKDYHSLLNEIVKRGGKIEDLAKALSEHMQP